MPKLCHEFGEKECNHAAFLFMFGGQQQLTRAEEEPAGIAGAWTPAGSETRQGGEKGLKGAVVVGALAEGRPTPE